MSDSHSLVIYEILTRHVPDVRVCFMWETNGAVLQNSQQMHRIFEIETAFSEASEAIAAAAG